MIRTFLHVGSGSKYKDQTTSAFNSPDWAEVRFDIDPSGTPDILGSMLDMSGVATASMDAVYTSHNIEHVYAHEVPVALAEFRRVLKGDGFIVVTCPDLQAICQLVAEDKLFEPAYNSPAGPIAPIDVLYGHRQSLAAGDLYMAHRCGFTQKVLTGSLLAAGFAKVAARRRGYPHFDLWAVASVNEQPDAALQAVAILHVPK